MCVCVCVSVHVCVYGSECVWGGGGERDENLIMTLAHGSEPRTQAPLRGRWKRYNIMVHTTLFSCKIDRINYTRGSLISWQFWR